MASKNISRLGKVTISLGELGLAEFLFEKDIKSGAYSVLVCPSELEDVEVETKEFQIVNLIFKNWVAVPLTDDEPKADIQLRQVEVTKILEAAKAEFYDSPEKPDIDTFDESMVDITMQGVQLRQTSKPTRREIVVVTTSKGLSPKKSRRYDLYCKLSRKQQNEVARNILKNG